MPGVNTLQFDSAKSDDCVDFLIITALWQELNAVLKRLGCCQKIEEGSYPTYYRKTLNTDSESNQKNLEVAVTMLSKVGNVHAAEHTTRCIQFLKPHFVLMVGIAGGIRDTVNLGDVVVSNKIVCYEYSKETPSGAVQRNEVESVDWLLLDRAMNRDNEWHTLIRAKRPTNTNIRELPQVHFAPIASGEKVIADENRVRELMRSDRKIAAIEMESFGVAVAAAKSEIRPRFIAIRGISDYADDKKNDDWHEYAADSAAAFTIEFLRSGAIPSPDNSHPPIPKTVIAIRHHSLDTLPNRLTEATLPETWGPANLVHVEINQTDLYDNGRLTNPVEATRRQMDIIPQLSEAVSSHPDAKLCYYGIVHIPLLFHIGSRVLTRMPLHFFEHNRTSHQWDGLQRGGDYPQIRLAGLPDMVSQKCGDVIVRISVSYLVTPEGVEGIVVNPIASMHLSIDQPKRDAVTSMNQIEMYSAAFRDLLDEIHKILPNTECVHIFYAGPVALAVNFGHQISKTIHPRIIVYNYSSNDYPPGYAWGLEVTADVDSPNFMITTRR